MELVKNWRVTEIHPRSQCSIFQWTNLCYRWWISVNFSLHLTIDKLKMVTVILNVKYDRQSRACHSNKLSPTSVTHTNVNVMLIIIKGLSKFMTSKMRKSSSTKLWVDSQLVDLIGTHPCSLPIKVSVINNLAFSTKIQIRS